MNEHRRIRQPSSIQRKRIAMKTLHFLFILMLLALGTAGCTPYYIKQVDDPTVAISRPGYRMLPPAAGWSYYERGKAGNHTLTLFKELETPSHTVVVTVTEMYNTASFKKQEEFLSFMTNSLRMDMDPRRFNLLKEETVLDNRFGPYSLRFFEEVEDHGATNADGSLPFLPMKFTGYLFIHPWITNMMVQVAYSERGTAAELDGDFMATAQKIFSGFTVTGEGK